MPLEKPNINCDLGEGGDNDAALMPLITSCNIACGGHYGDLDSMRTAINLAQKDKVLIGAHPSYPDMENFGRKTITISAAELAGSVLSQVETFNRVCREEGAKMNHIKFHGALYNDLNINSKLAQVVLDSLDNFTSLVALFVFPNSEIERLANFKTIREGFIDRSYTPGGQLVNRSLPNALIKDKEEAWDQLYYLWRQHPQKIETFCIHGDTSNALEILQFIHKQLNASS